MRTTTVTTLTKKGQATIPKRIREYLRIKPNDKIEFTIEEGDVKIKPARSLEANLGRVQPKRTPEDFREIRRMFEEQITALYLEQTYLPHKHSLGSPNISLYASTTVR